LKALIVVFGIGATALVFAGGFAFGRHYEFQEFEVVKLAAVAQAEKLIDSDRIEEGLRLLYLAKASERELGSMDSQLGSAYLRLDRPCLAHAYFTSAIQYMERNKLTALRTYLTVQEHATQSRERCGAE